jgi:hypothetical protein
VLWWRLRDNEPPDSLLVSAVILTNTSVGATLDIPSHLHVECAEVFLRPTDLESYAI